MRVVGTWSWRHVGRRMAAWWEEIVDPPTVPRRQAPPDRQELGGQRPAVARPVPGAIAATRRAAAGVRRWSRVLEQGLGHAADDADAQGRGRPAPISGLLRGPRRLLGAPAASWVAALVLAFAVGLWAGGAAFVTPPGAEGPAVPAAATSTPTRRPLRIVRSVPTSVKAVALTFDDGPSPRYTPAVVNLLKEYGAKATFFVIGQEVERFPDLVRAEVDAGNEIGNHGYHHVALQGVSAERLTAEVRTAEQTLVSLTGNRPALYRLPQGRGDPAALRALADMGYTIVMWSVDTRDYMFRSPAAIVAQVQKQVRPGSIIIFHDGGGNQQHTVDALKQLLPWLKEQGYQMLTVSQLLQLPRPGVTPAPSPTATASGTS